MIWYILAAVTVFAANHSKPDLPGWAIWAIIGVFSACKVFEDAQRAAAKQAAEEKEREDREYALKMAVLERGLPVAEEVDDRPSRRRPA